MDRKLYRYEYWTLDGGLLTDYAWITSPENAVSEILGLESQDRIYKLILATQVEIDAYHAGYAEGHDVGKLTERLADWCGTSYEVELPIVDDADLSFVEKFICGKCNEHRSPTEDSGRVIYVGLHGTEWKVCTNCEEGTRP